MPYTIRVRRDTESNWTTANPILALGEIGYDVTNDKMKVGNGIATWSSLTYLNADPSIHVHGMGDLSDFQVTNPIVGQVFRYSGTKWVNDPPENLTDGGNF
jgi:hypothetical protein